MNKKGDSRRIFGTWAHNNREDLAGEHPYGDSGQIIALVIFLMIWIFDSFVFRLSTFLASYIPLSVRLIFAAVFFVIAGFFARSGLRDVFNETRDPPRVIDTGVFSRVRHPIYLAAVLLYGGFTSTTLSLLSLAFLVVICVFYDYLATFEEKQLERKFGREYLAYKEKTPKWFPRLKAGAFD
jgi:protein-S-isoprenylcysteine O-methyltransferase Ste14